MDVDVHGDARGMDSWRRLKHELGAAHREHDPSSRRRQGAFTVYYVAGTHRVGNSVGRLGDGIDVRAEGGYVVAPPSSIDGAPYVWKADHDLDSLAPLPASLGERLSFARAQVPNAARAVIDGQDPQGKASQHPGEHGRHDGQPRLRRERDPGGPPRGGGRAL